jgi:hypothetical protein
MAVDSFIEDLVTWPQRRVTIAAEKGTW